MFGRLFGLGGASATAVDYDETRRALEKGECALIDVREPGEFAAGHVAGSKNMPLSRFDPTKLPADRRVILICLSGARSATAVRQAHAAGRGDVAHYSGGVAGWRRNGGALSR